MKILAVAEMQMGRLKPANGATIRFGQDLAARTGGPFSIAVLGLGVSEAAAELNRWGAERVHVIDDAALEHYVAQTFADAVAALVRAEGFDAVVGCDGTTGRDVYPRLAGALEAGMVRGACGIEEHEGAICYSRVVFSGGGVNIEQIHTAIQVVTVDPTAIDDPAEGLAGEAVQFEWSGEPADGVRWVELRHTESSRPDLAVAERVVSIGRGVKSAENVEQMGALADKLGAALGATRAVVDAGWMPNEYQVGQTGKSVAPKLYLALGISGAVQHIAGMRGSKLIVAVNKDPEAPIFKVADIGIVADLFSVVPVLMEEL